MFDAQLPLTLVLLLIAFEKNPAIYKHPFCVCLSLRLLYKSILF